MWAADELFMVTDPPTSPAKYRDQIFFGVMTAVIAYGASKLICPKPIYHALADFFLARFPRSARR